MWKGFSLVPALALLSSLAAAQPAVAPPENRWDLTPRATGSYDPGLSADRLAERTPTSASCPSPMCPPAPSTLAD